MERTGLESVKLANKHIAGRRLQGINRFGVGGWQFHFGESVTLTTECNWRIVSATKIEITSDDDGQKFGLPEPIDSRVEALKLVVDESVLDVQVDPSCADLILRFGAVRLEIVNHSSAYEAWTLAAPGLLMVGRNGDR